MTTPTTGRTVTLSRVVAATGTATAVGSGSLDVLGTPVLLAWCEAATCAVVEDALEAGSTTVGTSVRIDHLAASAIGDTVTLNATLAEADGRTLRFDVSATDAHGRTLCEGEIVRAVVDAGKFLARLQGRTPADETISRTRT